MKKTYNINITGVGFTIDEDAYEMLDSYLSTLTEICRQAGERETADDIEQRIAELFAERLAAERRTILTRRDVEDVISRIGSPEDIVEVEVVAEESPEAVQPPSPGAVPPPVGSAPPRNPFAAGNPLKKRLYRDVDNRILGGVCSGLAWYLGIDPVWVRIIAVLLTLLSATTLVVIYIILWIVIPPADTPYRRMEMMGADRSVSNVGKVVRGEYEGSRGVSQGMRTAGNVAVTVIAIIGLIVVGALLLAVGAAFLGCLTALLITPVGDSITDMNQTRLILGTVIGGTVIVAIPLFLLFRYMICALQGRPRETINRTTLILMAVFGILGLAAVVTCGCLLSALY